MHMKSSWTAEHTVDIATSPETVWALFQNVAAWKEWNAGVVNIALEGPFASGTWFTMTVPGGDQLRSCLVDVRENEGFTDETRIDDLVVTVAHRLTTIEGGRTRVTYAIETAGPGAADIGPAISADFPDVLAALAARAVG